jgi:hypothetical protein
MRTTKRRCLTVALVSTVFTISLVGCSESGSSSSNSGSSSSNSGSSNSIGQNWTKTESVDAFTDVVTRQYSATSQTSAITVYCAPDLSIIIQFPSQSGMGMPGTVNAEIRIDQGEVTEYPMRVRWQAYTGNFGNAVPEDAEKFYTLISGKSRLAVDIYAALRDSFNITGIDAVINDMKPLCDFIK